MTLELRIVVGSTRPGPAQAHQAFGDDGRPRDPRSDARLTVLLDDLAW